MARNRSLKRIPKICHHKPTGQGYVRIEGHCYYLGRYDDPATHEKGHRLIAEWLANGRRLQPHAKDLTVKELLAAYWEHCEVYYRRPDGTPSERTLGAIASALATVVHLYANTIADDFGPLSLRACREQWIEKGLRYTTVNKHVAQVKRAFKWGVSQELVTPTVYQGLASIEGLRPGRSKAKESRVVKPVPEAHVFAIEAFVSRPVWGLVRLQLFTGARSGELLQLRRCDIDTSGDVWTVRLEAHKTSHKGKARTLYIGRKGQEVLQDFFSGKGPFEYLFSPREAERERFSQCKTHRHQPVKAPRTDRRVGDHYTAASYRRAIERACKLAGVPDWHPHQLRHTCATMLRKNFGLDAAAVYLGHAKADVTQIYAEIDEAQAVDIARKVG